MFPRERCSVSVCKASVYAHISHTLQRLLSSNVENIKYYAVSPSDFRLSCQLLVVPFSQNGRQATEFLPVEAGHTCVLGFCEF